MQALVKNWFRDKESGFLDNGGGPDILVLKSDLIGCQFLKVGVNVEFECHLHNQNLIARKVKLLRQKPEHRQNNTGNRNVKKSPFGVMT